MGNVIIFNVARQPVLPHFLLFSIENPNFDIFIVFGNC